MFKDNLKRIMSEKRISASELSQLSGIGKSSISQYLSGKNVPPPERICILAAAIGCDTADLENESTTTVRVYQREVSPDGVFNVPVEIAAKLMHKKNIFLYEGLKQGIFPFGYAVKVSGKYSYFISSKKFEECTGIKVGEEL